MSFKVRILRAKGGEETIEVNALHEIEKHIGAMGLDTVNLRTEDQQIMLVDDMGHQRPDRPEVNIEATKLYHSVCRPGTIHMILGDAAIVRDNEVGQ